MQFVDKIDHDILISKTTFSENNYYVTKCFTKREKEILNLLADGLSSKQIAEKIFVSEYTVINHRRNMQEKSNMPNIAALVSFAIRSGII